MSDVEDFRRRSEELTYLKGVGAILASAQETMMPPGGTALRAQKRATVSGIHHDKLTDPELGKLLDRLEESDLDDPEWAGLNELKREYEKAVCLPQELVREMAEVTVAHRSRTHRGDYRETSFARSFHRLSGEQVRRALSVVRII